MNNPRVVSVSRIGTKNISFNRDDGSKVKYSCWYVYQDRILSTLVQVYELKKKKSKR